MGLAFLCPGGDALDDGFEALFMRSINFDSDNVKSTLRSFSFNGRDSQPAILKAFGSGKLIIEGSLSFGRRESETFQLETKISIKSPTSSEKESPMKLGSSRFCPSKEQKLESPVVQMSTPKDRAAVKLQKVYKSFRTRRQLADCAVLVEQRWWKLLDFALLKRSSVSFFDIEEPESVVSRWLRARRRAATVGKGLSKDDKARKLALQHWLEAIDPRHRYGHNLHFYYVCWLHCESKEPFFYWLDVGEGKEINLESKCPRSKLQKQCIKYLGPKERGVYEVIVEDGKFVYKQSRKVLDTSEGSEDTKWIFVLSTSKSLYVGQKQKGTFQHSSFLAGGATSAAGRLVVKDGVLKAVWPHSGHYRPTAENFQDFMSFLKENYVDLTDVKKSPIEEDDELRVLKSFHSGLKTEQSSTIASTETSNTSATKIVGSCSQSRRTVSSNSPIALRPDTAETANFMKGQNTNQEVSNINTSLEEGPIESKQHYIFCKKNLFVEEQEEEGEASVPQELILQRINSKKKMESYQLGKQLSCKWTTGAGPRIGCVRDYPSELQFRALEQMNLSPRSPGGSRTYPSPRITSAQSPRLPELPPMIVPLLQKPNIHRFKRQA